MVCGGEGDRRTPLVVLGHFCKQLILLKNGTKETTWGLVHREREKKVPLKKSHDLGVPNLLWRPMFLGPHNRDGNLGVRGHEIQIALGSS